MGSWSARANEGSERVGPSCACMPRREKVAPAEPRDVGDEGGCHAFLAWRGMHAHDGPTLFSITSFAREMRKEPTRSEALLWRCLCGKQLGVRVRRQHVLWPFICDFFVPAYKLVVEVDGAVHDGAEAWARDAWRDAELARVYDVRVLRIDAALVERDRFAAATLVRAALG